MRFDNELRGGAKSHPIYLFRLDFLFLIFELFFKIAKYKILQVTLNQFFALKNNMKP